MPVRLHLQCPGTPEQHTGFCTTQPDCATLSLHPLLCLFAFLSPLLNEQKGERVLFYLFIDSK